MSQSKNRWFTHFSLHRELNINLKYTTISPLRIGTSKGKSLFSPIDLQVIRMTIYDKEIPYIPGSSLKGIFRSTAEMLLRSHDKKACSMGQCSKEILGDRSRDEHLQDAIKDYNKGANDATIERVINILDGYCLICKIFGSNTYASHITFRDAYPTENVSIGVKTGIAINRRSGAAKRGALYQVEFINPGAIFHGSIKCINLPNYAVGLILTIIERMINTGIVSIGGFKSRGFGNIKIDIEDINGIIVEEGKVKNIKEIDEFKALDEHDNNVKRTGNIDELVKEFISSWDHYVSTNN